MLQQISAKLRREHSDAQGTLECEPKYDCSEVARDSYQKVRISARSYVEQAELRNGPNAPTEQLK